MKLSHLGLQAWRESMDIRGNPQKNVLNLVLRCEILGNYERSPLKSGGRSLQQVACIACIIGGFPHAGQVLYSIKPVACSSLATSGCSVDSLLVVNIPETVQRIENEAFTSCHFLVPLREFVFIAFFLILFWVGFWPCLKEPTLW